MRTVAGGRGRSNGKARPAEASAAMAHTTKVFPTPGSPIISVTFFRKMRLSHTLSTVSTSTVSSRTTSRFR